MQRIHGRQAPLPRPPGPAIEAGQAKRDGSTFATPKDAIGGIIYDLGISQDAESGKRVASYHCNPVM